MKNTKKYIIIIIRKQVFVKKVGATTHVIQVSSPFFSSHLVLSQMLLFLLLSHYHAHVMKTAKDKAVA